MRTLQAVIGFFFLVLFAAFLYNLRALVKSWWFSLDDETARYPFVCLECGETRYYAQPGQLSAALAAHWETDCTAVKEIQ